MGNGALAIGPKLPRPSSTLPSRQAPDGRYRISATVARTEADAAPDPAMQKRTFARAQSATVSMSPTTSAARGIVTALTRASLQMSLLRGLVRIIDLARLVRTSVVSTSGLGPVPPRGWLLLGES